MYIYFGLVSFIYFSLFTHEKIFNINVSEAELLDKGIFKIKYIYFIHIFIILATFSALRDGIGIDYGAYVINIENIASGYANYMEPGFRYLSEMVMKVRNNPRDVLVVCSYITIYFYVLSIFKLSKNVKMSIFLFLTWGYYFFTFTTVRNYLALGIVFYAMSFLLQNKTKKFILWVIIAAFFHKSVLICLPGYLIAVKKFNKKTFIFFIFISVLVFLMKEQLRTLVFMFYRDYEGSIYDTGRV